MLPLALAWGLEWAMSEMSAHGSASRRHAFARFVSIGFHPFALFPVGVAVTASPGLAPGDFALLMGMIALSFVCIAAYVGVQIRRGYISNIDVSRREQRPRFYAVAIASTLACALAFELAGVPKSVVAGSLVSAGLLFASLLVNTRLKASLHVAYTIFAIGIAWHVLSTPVRVVAGGLVLLMCWSRVELKRHTWAEVVAGAALGTSASLILRWLLGLRSSS